MEKMSEQRVRAEVLENEKLIEEITGRKPVFFRFPAGNYDGRTLRIIESLGYRVVHWTFASGDPDPNQSAERLMTRVAAQAIDGAILIFHINGRGYHTAEALPGIVEALRGKGFGFRGIEEALPPVTWRRFLFPRCLKFGGERMAKASG
jgi:peptidoglycan/xylan/chitin deacetylase (PgdA/CDA1 family)